MKDFLWSKVISIYWKKHMYKSYFKPVLTYASETWTWTKRNMSRIQVIEMKFLQGRPMIQKTIRDKIKMKRLGIN